MNLTKNGTEIHLDPGMERELAEECSEPARSLILELPDHIDLGEFIGEWAMIERLVKKTSGSFRKHREEGSSPVSSLNTLISYIDLMIFTLIISITAFLGRPPQIEMRLLFISLFAVWSFALLLQLRYVGVQQKDGPLLNAELTKQREEG